MSAPVVLSRSGLLARVFIGAWLLALVASAIARAVIAGPDQNGEALQAPAGVERPAAAESRPVVVPQAISDRLPHNS